MSDPEEDLILLTGATGYVGSHVLDSLVRQGYRVVVSVRTRAQENRIRERYSSYDRLAYVVIEDVVEEHCFDLVLKFNPTISHVIHLATPRLRYHISNKSQLFDPVIKANTNMISAIQSYGHSVKLLVIGSCFAAMLNNPPRLSDPRKIYSSRDVNLISKEDAVMHEYNAYVGAKTFAETYAWKHYSDLLGPHFSMICITLPMVFGPIIHDVDWNNPSTLNDSIKYVYDLLHSDSVSPFPFPFPFYVDVRDAALAYVKAIQHFPCTTNRWFVASNNVSSQHVVDILLKEFPYLSSSLPKGVPGNGDKELLQQCTFDTTDTDDLVGTNYIKLENTIIDMFNSFPQDANL
ncbi:hypothetical protein TRICI_002647 [Trichomonascus ciferrii]|uniref:NAD-dependent epimerase/dehydratase domain-containing protein n=1 Tax=Trichomonascus ciferrii TaxID=44093 RepID=A0A642V5L5_9ASCO|nr:hypothetical protein TRICI_002647 [Trichomonascus ciferrii]